MPALTLTLHPERYAVVQLRAADGLPAWFAFDAAPVTAAVRRSDELSLVAPEAVVPEDAGVVERGFRAFEVQGPLPFDATGIMAAVAQPLADASVSIFPLATYDTDIVLVPDAKIEMAKAALRAAGHTVESRTNEAGTGRQTGGPVTEAVATCCVSRRTPATLVTVPTSPVLAQLHVTEEQITRDLHMVRDRVAAADRRITREVAERDQLRAEEAALESLLAIVRTAAGDPADAFAQTEPRQPDPGADRNGTPGDPEPEVDAAASQAHADIAAPSGQPTSKRGPILRIMRDHPDHETWTPAQVRDALRERGIRIESSGARVTLRRMAEKGQIRKVGHGLYRLAEDQAALVAPDSATTMEVD